ncbi:diguanylate cyclase (GGDEF) domain-containing protein [Micromonospora phaseoli]|uniref:Diguanylate cyclase (GGDEF) domain-containing protein n=1 Tax=Micromonospora phaseoli TaxID=1144548 RepID=A0A1H6SIN4_9ACTN|nr:GGDEF domain-containing protein [Micromonospora phaseoli]PZW03818.1 diguanylate cyclase (GGDEF)-like protein [Micromonospora phaseoli]GIJ79120.1 diguanylate cyclase [Micromonospora phaseoli]SEI63362.1 diguanylate cyclase (GGDEF) domain-containing protein [Micromonospora phaseoli]
MDDVTLRALRLLEEAQSGRAAQVLATAESALREPTGEIRGGPAAMHFARVVALTRLGDLRAAIDATDLMLAAAEREGSVGWRSCALSLRATRRLRLGDQDIAEYDIEAVLRDLTSAETALLPDEPDPVIAGNAHTGIAIGYAQLRLYELAAPQFQAAYEATCRASYPDNGNRAMWLCNLAELNLLWALELYQVGQVAEAEKHTTAAEEYAVRAVAEASGPKAEVWRLSALLYAACARADRQDPAGAAADIPRYVTRLQAHGMEQRQQELLLCRPFHAVALSRSGRPDEALRVIEDAVTHLSPDSDWLVSAALHRTHAVLLANNGSSDALPGLTYGDALAELLWRQRHRWLHAAVTMQSYDVLRWQHEQAEQAAQVDPLTGVANRRGLDNFLRNLTAPATSSDGESVAVLIVDLDQFKHINDSLGHATGDDVLRAVAQVLTTNVRKGDFVARLGGDEFVAILPGADSVAAEQVAQRTVTAVADMPAWRVQVSVGVASGSVYALGETLAHADGAMYAAKRAGGNRTSCRHPTP